MTKSQTIQHTKETKKDNTNILGRAEVRPGRMEKISLGMYEQGMPEPTLTLEFEPDVSDTMNASLVWLDEGDHYTLVYQVQNFGDVACWVRVRLGRTALRLYGRAADVAVVILGHCSSRTH